MAEFMKILGSPSECEERCPFDVSGNEVRLSNNTDTPIPKKLFRDSMGSKYFSPSPLGIKEKLGDRFIPCRASTNLQTKFLGEEEKIKTKRKDPILGSTTNGTGDASGGNSRNNSSNTSGEGSNSNAGSGLLSKEEQQLNSYSQLLQSQLLGDENATENICWDPYNTSSLEMSAGCATASKRGAKNFFKFKNEVRKSDPSCTGTSIIGMDADKFFPSAHAMMLNQTHRKISKVPFKVLDAPQLQDDFYLNLVDWSSQNLLTVGLGPSVYIWSACTSKVTKLCEVSPTNDSITSVAWSQRGTHLSVGVNSGETQIWDIQQLKLVRTLGGHLGRVSSISWNNSLLSTGSRDRTILQHDVRAPEDYQQKLVGHKQEVCGLKWSFDGQQLASGGNDNKLFLWNIQSTTPVAKFSDHQAAVKAIAWSPHQHGLLASGGGTADRTIKFWNTLTLECVKSLDTGSQVCNLMFSKNDNELVSTHGYSLNQIILWKYPQMQQVATLTGHTFRVLYLSMSPDGESIVTGAGDETLRFWNVFPPLKTKTVNIFGCSSGLIPPSMDIR